LQRYLTLGLVDKKFASYDSGINQAIFPFQISQILAPPYCLPPRFSDLATYLRIYIVPEIIDPGPIFITDLFQNKYLAGYFNPK
jgi:hypothetical protein